MRRNEPSPVLRGVEVYCSNEAPDEQSGSACQGKGDSDGAAHGAFVEYLDEIRSRLSVGGTLRVASRPVPPDGRTGKQ